MVTLTLFLIGATPMITIDSCPQFQINTMVEKSSFVTSFPNTHVDILFSDMDIWSLGELAVLEAEKSNNKRFPREDFPTVSLKYTLFFDKHLLNGSSGISMTNINNCLVQYTPNA